VDSQADAVDDLPERRDDVPVPGDLECRGEMDGFIGMPRLAIAWSRAIASANCSKRTSIATAMACGDATSAPPVRAGGGGSAARIAGGTSRGSMLTATASHSTICARSQPSFPS
jgi:hypothetical protein